MNKIEILKWLQGQKYQTERSDTQEYTLYFELDMPRILEDYHQWRQSKPATIPCEHKWKSVDPGYSGTCFVCDKCGAED